MTYTTHNIEEFALSLPITQLARSTAQQFASEQPTTQKAEQVRLNTLAVFVVNDYLQQMMGIPCDLAKSDSWNPVIRLCADVADLEVAGVGRLECRPQRGDQPSCLVPVEVWSDRIGYVVVQIDESSWEATVLGFAQTVTTQDLPLSQLQPVEDLFDRLSELRQPVEILAAQTPAVALEKARVNLSQWLSNVFDTSWQTIESLINPTEMDLAFSFRSPSMCLEPTETEHSAMSVRRAKLVDLGMQLAGYPVALIVELTPESEQKRNILLQVHPLENYPYLPPLLQLTVLDESGLIFLEAEARSADNYIQLQFRGIAGEQFSVKVALGEASIMEDFVI